MKFEELGLHEDILEGIRPMNFDQMTPVQEQTIPVIMEGRDLIGCAQTGTGKTAAYTLPLLERLLREGNPDNVVKSLIVVPTRELAQQIDVQFQGFSYFLPLSTTVVYGGGDGFGWSEQKQGMLMGTDIVIATPGRLIAHIQNSGIDLSHVEYFVLDEADRMLDMGFFDDIMRIVSQLPSERQTIMFSATLPPKIRKLAKEIMHDPAEVNIAVSKPNEAIEQSAYVCYENQKMGIVRELFSKPAGTKTIIFSSSKQKVKELAFSLKRMKLNVAPMHSDLKQEQREEVMLDFKNGKIDVLVATDIVARGIDIEDIGTVINFDVPHDPEDYIHRIGRDGPGRGDRHGHYVCQREGAGQVPPDRDLHRAGNSQGRAAGAAGAGSRSTIPESESVAVAGAAGMDRAAEAATGAGTVAETPVPHSSRARIKAAVPPDVPEGAVMAGDPAGRRERKTPRVSLQGRIGTRYAVSRRMSAGCCVGAGKASLRGIL